LSFQEVAGTISPENHLLSYSEFIINIASVGRAASKFAGLSEKMLMQNPCPHINGNYYRLKLFCGAGAGMAAGQI